VLTRCKSKGGAVLIESPFLLKFKTICRKIGVTLDSGEKYFSQLLKKNNVGSRKISTPNPKPKIEFRPNRISITEISKLLENPYEIYAKKILQLKELEKIDFEPGYAEFGSFIHKALEEFVKNSEEKNFLKKSREIFSQYFLSDEAKLIWWPKFENIFADFKKENQRFLGLKNYVEIPEELQFGKILIRGKIDRVIVDNDGLAEIIDYKTGQVPSKKDVTLGVNPQLTIAALMLLEKSFNVERLSYWKLSSSSESEIKKICDNSEEIKILTAATKAGLKRLFEYFLDEENGYLAVDLEARSEYRNLVRSEEWSK